MRLVLISDTVLLELLGSLIVASLVVKYKVLTAALSVLNTREALDFEGNPWLAIDVRPLGLVNRYF